MCLKLDFSLLKFCCPFGSMCSKCFFVTVIGCIHNALCCSVVSNGDGLLAWWLRVADLFGALAGMLGANGCLWGFSQGFVLQHNHEPMSAQWLFVMRCRGL